jgi:hypothetical protein
MNSLTSTLGSGDALKDKLNKELKDAGLEEAKGISDPVKYKVEVGVMSSTGCRQSPLWALAPLAALGAMAI